MKGFRFIGRRKGKLINGPLNDQLNRLAKLNINGRAFLKREHNIIKPEDFKKIQTKKISGIISDLAELN